jgi:hypothetical protein
MAGVRWDVFGTLTFLSLPSPKIAYGRAWARMRLGRSWSYSQVLIALRTELGKIRAVRRRSSAEPWAAGSLGLVGSESEIGLGTRPGKAATGQPVNAGGLRIRLYISGQNCTMAEGAKMTHQI